MRSPAARPDALTRGEDLEAGRSRDAVIDTTIASCAWSACRTTSVVALGRAIGRRLPLERTELTVSLAPFCARYGSFGHSRKTRRSVAISGANLTDAVPVTTRKPLCTFTASTYRGNAGEGEARAPSTAQLLRAAAATPLDDAKAPTATAKMTAAARAGTF
jgi:hypothetical protein